MSALEQEIIDRIKHLDETRQRRVLLFLQSIEQPFEVKDYSIDDLMALPYEERNQVVASIIARSENEDFEIFEAYSEEDFDDAQSHTEG